MIKISWHEFFIVLLIMFPCLLIQEIQIKILTQISVLVSFFGGMYYMGWLHKKRGRK